MARSGTLVNAIGATIVLTLALVVGRLWITRAASGSPIDSVAVLPFFNANAAPEVDYLADGIPESIINSLSQLPNLKVMSRTSAFQFKGREVIAQDVGQKLGVRRVLAGRVAQRGDALAISIELVDTRDNSQVWGQHYNRKLADVFAVQEEMATEISGKLRVKLTGSRAWSFPTCSGSRTAQSPREARASASCDVAFRLMVRRRHSGCDYFAAQYPVCRCPCQRFGGSLAAGHA